MGFRTVVSPARWPIAAGLMMVLLLTLGGVAPRTAAQPAAAQPAGCQSFPQTGHTVCGRFLVYWQTHGGLAQQGYPLSEEFVETTPLDGKPHTVQYFERAVFEYHAENAPPYDVLLAQLGTYLAHQRYTQGFSVTGGQVPFMEDRTDPVLALNSFYNAINRKEYDRAYGYFEGAPNPNPSLAPPLAQFAAGYADTTSVTLAVGRVTSEGAAGSTYATVPVVITATHANGSTTVYSGCYTLWRTNPGISCDPTAVLWRIYQAQIGVAPAGKTVDQLLAQPCGQ